MRFYLVIILANVHYSQKYDDSPKETRLLRRKGTQSTIQNGFTQ